MPLICYSDEGAGLLDRLTLARTLSSFAIALGVSLRLDPPCRLLHPKHNGGVAVACSKSWDHYFTVFDATGRPMDLQAPGECGVSMTNFFTKTYSLSRHIATPNRALPRYNFSHRIHQLAAESLATLRLRPGAYDAIHIRRFDTKKVCKTDLATMRTRLARIAFRRTDVVFFSDERDVSYRNGVERILTQRGLRVHDVDEVLRAREDDNYIAFGAERVIAESARRFHEWRKTFSCP